MHLRIYLLYYWAMKVLSNRANLLTSLWY